MDNVKIEQALEAISVHGCDHVREVLAQAKRNEPVAETQHLSQIEAVQVVEELQAIMAVYSPVS